MQNLNITLAFFAGFLSFLSPCILPLIPGYVSFLTGETLEYLETSVDNRRIMKRTVLSSCFFVLGFSLVFVFLGAAANFLGSFLAQHRVVLDRLAGTIIIVLGLHLTGVLRIRWLYKQKKIDFKQKSVSNGGAFALGFAFAFGWTPCVGPILAGILALAATEETLGRGVLLLVAYSGGIAIPFLMTALLISSFMTFFRKFRRYLQWAQVLAGLILIAVGILIFTDNFARLIRFVPDFFYDFAR